MGRLAGFKYREVARRLRTFGFVFDRPGPGSHEIWRHLETGRKTETKSPKAAIKKFGRTGFLCVVFRQRRA